MLALHIPKPCHQAWRSMQPTDAGRHCPSCAKTVIDFTQMSDNEVNNYFIKNGIANTCARFKNKQLSPAAIIIPISVLSMPIATWKKILAAALIAFSALLIGCESKLGKAAVTQSQAGSNLLPQIINNNFTATLDTPKTKHNITQGAPVASIVTHNKGNNSFITGEIAIIENTLLHEVLGKIAPDSIVFKSKNDTVK